MFTDDISLVNVDESWEKLKLNVEINLEHIMSVWKISIIDYY